jgi:hypothetical protein
MIKVIPRIEKQANLRPTEKPIQIMSFSGQFETECNQSYKLYMRNESDLSLPKSKMLNKLICMDRSQLSRNIA